MLGAIIGDVAGSYPEVLEIKHFKVAKMPTSYEERMKIMNKEVPLFTENSSCTDDSILTCAIADAVLSESQNYEKYLREYGIRELKLGKDMYQRSRFGSGFVKWLEGDYQGISYGNGCAMRISPVGYLDTLEEVKKETYLATIPSHNSKEAIQGAMAVSTSIYLLRHGTTKEELKKYIENNFYSLDFNLEQLRKEYIFTMRTSECVPQAFYIFLISDSFEDSIRKAISIGGDTDTIAAIVGSLSEAYYGLDQNLVDGVMPYLRDYMYPLVDKFYEKKKGLYLRKQD